MVQSLGKSTTGCSSLSSPRLTPVATTRPEGFLRAGCGSIQRMRLQGGSSSRDSAPDRHARRLKLVLAKADSRRDDQARRVPEGWMRLYPAYEAPGSLLQPRFRAILALQPVLHDLELEGSDGRKKGRPWRSRPGRERLDDALLQELLKARPEFLGVGRIGVRYVGEDLRRESRNLVEKDRAVLRQRVADPEGIMAHEPDDIAGPRLVDGFALLPEELVRGGQAHALAGLRVQDRHVPSESARADAQKGDPVAVPGVHVGLDLEDEARELVAVHGHLA